MATGALALRGRSHSDVALLAPLFVGTAGTFLSWFGAGWDVSWHRMLGRDTFWSAPHLFLYSGVAFWGIAALIATATATAGRPVHGRPIHLGPLRAELGLALVGLGALAVILSAPFDSLWHAWFGRDVDIWSPPHLAGIAGGALGLLGWVAAFGPGVFPIADRPRRLLRLLMLGNLCATCIFALNFYYILAVTREAFFYPLLVAALIPAALAIATTVLRERWAATAAALAYTIVALVGYVLLAGGGWRPPAFPALIVVGAIAIDVLRSRRDVWSQPLVLGLAFSVGFVAAETARLLLFPPPAPTVAGGGLEPRLTNLFFQYYGQALARPWLSGWPVAAAIVGAPVAAMSWLVGRRIGAALSDELDSKALAHP
jgi:hypothetical protein